MCVPVLLHYGGGHIKNPAADWDRFAQKAGVDYESSPA